jgi:uncharacterized GH25 family protein
MRNAFLLAITLLLSAFAGSAAAQTTKLRIEVRSLSGKPVDRASVLVRFVEGRSVVKLGKKIRTSWELKTNQDGVATIPPIPQGQIMVQVIAKNYQTFGQKFDINEEEKTIEVKLKPPQSQYSAHQ